MILNSRRTIYALDMSIKNMLNKPYEPLPNTTLNEKFNFLYDAKLEETDRLSISYFGIGVGGIKYIEDNDSYKYVEHLPVDAALYEQIPFVMREPNNDLNIDEQAKYRFRIKEIWGGVEYICYYLKAIDKNVTINNIFSISKLNDKYTLSKFNTNTSTYLNPDPNYESEVINNDAEYVTSVAKLKFSLLSSELKEIDNVLTIRYGNTDKAISELAICSGVDKVLSDNTNPEAIAVQVCYFANIDIKTTIMKNINNEVIRAIEIGGLEPLKV